METDFSGKTPRHCGIVPVGAPVFWPLSFLQPKRALRAAVSSACKACQRVMLGQIGVFTGR